MLTPKKPLILAIDLKKEQLDRLTILCKEKGVLAVFYPTHSINYLTEPTHPEPDLILLNQNDKDTQNTGITEAISESPHPFILIQSPDHHAAIYPPNWPNLRDTVFEDNIEKTAQSIKRELETLSLKHQLKETSFMLDTISRGLNSIVSNSNEAAALIHNGRYLKANRAYKKLFAITSATPLASIKAPEPIILLDRHSKSLGQTTNKIIKSSSLTRLSGESFHAELLAFPLKISNKDCLQIIVRTPSFQDKLSEKAQQQLLHKDELTGLVNRQHFFKLLDNQLTSLAHDKNGILALILIDRFKEIREERGILNSDKILSRISRLIEHNCHSKDLIGRFGDAVFSIYSTRFNSETFSDFVEQIRLAIAETLFETNEDYLQLTCSIGVTLWDEQASDIEELITRADQACAEANTNGGNQTQLYQGLSTALESHREKAQFAEISSALKENRFKLIYQPIVNLGASSSESYAILLRMIDSDKKHVAPDRFIHFAEKSGLICKIDKWVVHQTCQLIKRAKNSKTNRLFFVKLSGKSLDNKKFLLHLYNCLKETGINGNALVFQVDYAEYRTRPAVLKNFILGIKKVHCQFSFDHFGFGKFKSMDLSGLPIDYLKIDGIFVRDLLINPDHRATIKRVISATKPLKIKTIAKSVENANTLAVLWNLGVNAVQGYFLQEPSEIMKYNFSHNDAEKDSTPFR